MPVSIILIEDVPHVGALGDTVQVKPGYARNYLIPQGKAMMASSKKSKELKHHLQHLEKKRQGAIAEAKGKAEKLKAMELELRKKAGDNGKLFGSVTTQQLEQLLGGLGFSVDRKAIMLHEPIKSVGTHSFDVRLHTEVKVTLSIKVVAETSIEENPEPSEASSGVPEPSSEGSSGEAPQAAASENASN